MKFKIVEHLDERAHNVISDYKKFANLSKDAKVEEIDEWALNEAACKNNYRKDKLKEELLESSKLEEGVSVE